MKFSVYIALDGWQLPTLPILWKLSHLHIMAFISNIPLYYYNFCFDDPAWLSAVTAA